VCAAAGRREPAAILLHGVYISQPVVQPVAQPVVQWARIHVRPNQFHFVAAYQEPRQAAGMTTGASRYPFQNLQ